MKKTFFIPILIFISFLLDVYLVFPTYTQLNNLQDAISQEELVLQQGQGYLFNLRRVATDLKNYQEAFKRIDSALPKDPSLASLMSFFQTEASNNGLVLHDMGVSEFLYGEPASVGEQLVINEVPFSLSLSGSVPSFENFLKSIEKSSRLIEVENIALDGEETEEQLPTLNLGIKVYSY